MRQTAADSEEPAPASAASRARLRRPSRLQALAKRLGLHLVTAETLSIRRRRSGKGFAYVRPDGSAVRDRREIRRLASLAVPH